jgi:hypothetical protein
MHLLFALCSGDNHEICVYRLPRHSRAPLEWGAVFSSRYRARRNDGQVPQRSGARVLRNIQVFRQRELGQLHKERTRCVSIVTRAPWL